ncbi:MAG: division/cell wall cluster transcriptional repressor MraZ [Paracoccus sp. (in: a-proteobacteria)]|uniref:division/cell wall cluster transcriptional repressor MraZ n=1 Tax=Paracoccus sp. TaxID=267 RepID=UPI0026DEB1C9|nr:division/cell wall cluster transcriptional repressor MraZ [Paracoccus sp. (in: a-proteobacteria)]MDO5620135.1 division/cell wall cluster transcriptional repressor MraZ [Paracoccus sp. (in: a-proteobacteria)]
MARRFRGSEDVKIDAKGRMSVPARFRRVFELSDPDFESGRRAQMVIVYGGPQQDHLKLYTIEAIEEIDAQIHRMPRGSVQRLVLERLMNGQSIEAEIDDDGRLVMPQKLRDKLGLTDRAHMVASGDYLKLWAAEDQQDADAELDAFIDSLEPGTDLLSLLPGLPEEG